MIPARPQGKSYDWHELAALLPNGKMVRGHYVRRDDSAGISAWRRRLHNTNIFSSIGLLREPSNTSECILPLYFDIDCPADLEAARESTISLCEMLMDRIRLPQDCLDIAFSGSKGFHVVVAPEVFLGFYSPHTLGLYKEIVRRARDAGVRHLDAGVYTARRLWRLVNSKHGKSELHKSPVRYEELRDMTIDRIKALAQNPRPDDTFARHQVCKEAAEWYRKAIAAFAQSQANSRPHVTAGKTFRKGWRTPPCIRAIQETTLPDGIRHCAYAALARFCSWINMHPKEIRERIEALDSRNPIRDPDYIERTVEWGCRHPGFPGCGDESLHRYCQPDNCFYVKLKNDKQNQQPA